MFLSYIVIILFVVFVLVGVYYAADLGMNLFGHLVEFISAALGSLGGLLIVGLFLVAIGLASLRGSTK